MEVPLVSNRWGAELAGPAGKTREIEKRTLDIWEGPFTVTALSNGLWVARWPLRAPV